MMTTITEQLSPPPRGDMEITNDTKLTLAYVTSLVGKLHCMRRDQASELECLILGRAAKVVFWTAECDYVLEREVYDIVDNSGGMPPLPTAVDWNVLTRFNAAMNELKNRNSNLAQVYDGAKNLLQRVLNRLARRVELARAS